jgi:hypothetical protein
MKGETLLSLRELAIVMGIFTGAVVLVVVIGYVAFKRWKKREDLRRGRQIAMAYIDPECAVVPKKTIEP